MLGWFVDWLNRLVRLGLELAFELIRGLVGAPATAARRATAAIVVREGRADEVIDVRHQVLREGRPRSTATFDGDTALGTRHWVAVQADRVVGVVSVMEAALPVDGVDPRPMHQLRGMAVLPELRGSGLGARLLEATHAEGRPMWCNARAHVVAFYARHGWQPIGEPFDIPEVGPHQRMWTSART